jgi:hypothetical protein
MRSMVEGACGGSASGEADAPSTALDAVPLPRCAGQDEVRGVIASVSEAIQGGLRGKLDCFVAIAPRNDESWLAPLQPREGRTMRRKLSAPAWRFPRRMTLKQWTTLPYRERHAYLAQAQCTLLEYWRDCAQARCRRAQRCLVPYPCYWQRKHAMTAAEQAEAERACGPLRALLSLGSLKGAEGLWLF